MSDGMSQAAAWQQDTRERGYAKYGHLSKDELIVVLDRIKLQLDTARTNRDELDRVINLLERKEDETAAVLYDWLNIRPKST